MSVIACASQTHKKNKPNQDYCVCFENKILGFKGVIVADGLGSHFNSELSSKFCAEKLKEKLELIEILPIRFKELFEEVKTDLIDFSENELNIENRAQSDLGTTLLCAVDFPEEYHFSYVGNGSIWQISGNFNHFKNTRSLPWNSINLLNPHNREENGVSKMFKYMSTSDTSVIPSEIKLSKNDDCYGDIIIICTDGVYSSDESKMGFDNKGVLWIMGEETIIELYKSLNNLFVDLPSDITENLLSLNLENYLNILKENDIMDDDTTLGVIVSDKTVQYQKLCYESRSRVLSSEIKNDSGTRLSD
jgi:serine/threonine protein phosphatase PrpC